MRRQTSASLLEHGWQRDEEAGEGGRQEEVGLHLHLEGGGQQWPWHVSKEE